MTRTVADLAMVLDVIVGYDAEDPLTAYGAGHIPASYRQFLDRDGLKGARIGVLREAMGWNSEPESEDFAIVSRSFDQALDELTRAGATLIDPITIPRLNELLAKRSNGSSDGQDRSWDVYFGRSANPPFKSREEMLQSPAYSQVYSRPRTGLRAPGRAQPTRLDYLDAREELMTSVLKLMADHELDAIVHKTVEHQPTLIKERFEPPYHDMRGGTNLNTFLIFVPSITVPAGFTSDNLPFGITFLGRPYSDGEMIRLAYGYEQATLHRRPPGSTPPLSGEP
jgi:Asp-tRNA(Asn)/Glu-tRNA(Gln) amidotransferase A subunit family amidase